LTQDIRSLKSSSCTCKVWWEWSVFRGGSKSLHWYVSARIVLTTLLI
jgi:hypothetical protein